MHTNLELHALVSLFALITSLLFGASPAFAQESSSPTLFSLSPPSTYFVVVGANSGDYKNAPGLTGASGGGDDCVALTRHLQVQGFDEKHLLSFCGPELVRTRLFARLSDLTKNIEAGSTLVVVWIGHGGLEPQTNTPLFLATDGSFDLFVDKDTTLTAASGYYQDGISPQLLYGFTRQNLPTNARVVFITDAARGGLYSANGGTLVLEGPSAEDFRDMPGVYALSPTAGKAVPTSLTRTILSACITAPTLGAGELTARAFLACYAEGMTRGGNVTIETAGAWGDEPLVRFPSPVISPAVVSPAATHSLPVGKIIVVSGGGIMTLVGGVGAITTFVEARHLGEDIASGNYGAPGDPTLQTAVERYNAHADALTAWYVVTGAGALITGTGALLPLPHALQEHVTMAPLGVVIHGSF